ncbi:unnamed protein product [Paramecium sonneborni]|uniref:Uncharacterized protein n=1 Tax=Paramecium sonneborni TaxID=65129 RepID=A0A8S1NDB5_9CILI|nr:unnamed protein product [Paramecium sonneborni]
MNRLLLKFKFTEWQSTYQHFKIKRFYKEAKIERTFGVGMLNQNHQWIIKLDGKIVQTHFQNELILPTSQLAQSIADEFNSQKEFIQTTTMPLLILAKNAVGIETNQRIRQFMEYSIINYLERDTVLFREQSQSQLYQIQQNKLDPQLKLFNQQFGMHLQINYGLEIKPLKQYDKIKIQNILKKLNSWQLVSLDSQVENLKSCILALQIWNNHITIQQAVQLSRIEEDYQISQNQKIEKHHDDLDENTIIAKVNAAKLLIQLIQIQSITY